MRPGGRDDRWLQFDAPKMAVATKEQRAQGTVVVAAGMKGVDEGEGEARRPGIVYGSIRHTKGEGEHTYGYTRAEERGAHRGGREENRGPREEKEGGS